MQRSGVRSPRRPPVSTFFSPSPRFRPGLFPANCVSALGFCTLAHYVGGAHMYPTRLIPVLFVACGLLSFGQAQISSGDITGTVSDASGGLIQGARITASNPDSGLSRSVESGR